ncbi:BamA/TamA family outer membrane protein [Persicobacter psychrovividus]|uniref:Bacterial surface antigen (D15) domain-containing protein n=1 Tax=Persicobacter psychrovividus TaxID=387638 RepID=A0ABM7VC38_9BACT|nr:hypothetical protein PEPS_07660 [Persicobacter psychrovividus]
MKFWLFLLFSFFLQNTFAQPHKGAKVVFVGGLASLTDPQLEERLRHELKTAQSVVLLGDYVPLAKKHRAVADEQLHKVDQLLKDFSGQVILTSGYNEWMGGRKEGKKNMRQLADAINARENWTTTAQACPNIVEVPVGDHLTFVVLDTQWWLNPEDRYFNKCGIEDPLDVLIELQDVLRRNTGRQVFVVGYHPIESYGHHGGYFSTGASILLAPYVLYRKALGLRYDLAFPEYKAVASRLKTILKAFPNVNYISGAEKNQQYFSVDGLPIRNTNMAEPDFVKPITEGFTAKQSAFVVLTADKSMEYEWSFIGTEGHIKAMKYTATPTAPVEQKRQLPPSASSVGSKLYHDKSGRKSRWMGANYRQVWETPVRATVFDISKVYGGLKVVKRGGGQQTMSLRLQDSTGRQYVLRTVDKNVLGALPAELQKTIAHSIVQDQISASNPYSALVVAPLSDVAGILHPVPKLVYVPDDPHFGIYRQDVADRLFFFEQRPDGDCSDLPHFGNSKKVISTKKMIKKMQSSEDHQVDQQAVLKARAFDIWLNDWDRHDDQWRWAGEKVGGLTVYQPIPRDRDQAFFVNEGILPKLMARQWLIPKIQGFSPYTAHVKSHAFNARFFDRTFLTSLSWAQWQPQIEALIADLDDASIDQAVKSFPKEIYPIAGQKTANMLKQRRDHLLPMMRQFYDFLAKEVDVVGTKDADQIQLDYLADGELRVRLWHLKKSGDKGRKLYDRRFRATETKYVHIYGLSGRDEVLIKGDRPSKIRVNIFSKGTKDTYRLLMEKPPRKLKIYTVDTLPKSSGLKRIQVRHYQQKEAKYDRERFQYAVLSPALALGYNIDDGAFVGGGGLYRSYRNFHYWRHRFVGNYAFLTRAFNLDLQSSLYLPLRGMAFDLQAFIKAPNFTINYFGLGNNTEWRVPRAERAFYRIRLNQYVGQFRGWKTLGDPFHRIGLGAFAQRTVVEPRIGRFISRLNINDLPANIFDGQSFLGLSVNYEFDNISGKRLKAEEQFAGSAIFPRRGYKVNASLKQYFGMGGLATDFTTYQMDMAGYFSFSQRPRVVYALRLGGQKNWGDYIFYEAAKLGRRENLRGYRATRFYGDASIYQNTEMRIRLRELNMYYLRGVVGLLLFNDVGRVWLEGEDSGRWHHGYGAGLWLAPFELAVLGFNYARSREDGMINFQFSYQF